MISMDINIVVMISTLIAVLFLLVVLNQLLYKPLLGFMENRDETIKSDLENASKNSSDVTSYQEEADNIILEAKNKALKIRIDIMNEAKLSAEKKVSDKKSELEVQYNNFLKNIGAEKDELKKTLLSQMPSYQEIMKNKLNQI